MSEPAFPHAGIDAPAEPMPGTGAGPGGLVELRRTVGEVVRVLSVRRWMFLVPFSVVVSASFMLSLYVPRSYTASTKFERRDDPVLVNLPSAGGMGAFELYRGTLTNDIKGIENLSEVVRTLNLADIPADADPERREGRIRATAARIAPTLQVLLHKRSTHLDVIEIQCTSPSPDRLAELLDETRDCYIRRTREQFTGKLRQTRDWFEEQRDKRGEIVSALERDLDVYQAEHLGINPLKLNDSLPQWGELRRDVERLERNEKEIETRLEGRTSLLASRVAAAKETPSATQASPAPSPPRYRSVETIRLLDEVKANREKTDSLRVDRGMTERHPEMIALRREERQLADALKERQDQDAAFIATHPSADSVDAAVPEDPWLATKAQIENDVQIHKQLLAQNAIDLEAAKRSLAEFTAARQAAVDDFQSFRARVSESARSDREREMFQGYIDQINRVLSAEDAERGVQFEKIQPAWTDSIPASPRLPSVVVFAALAGVATGVLLTLLSELFDRTIRARSQILRGLGLPILETIDEIVSAVARRRRFLRRAIFVPATTFAFALMVLTSGALAYLSLHDKNTYDRVMAWPRSTWRGVVAAEEVEAPVVVAHLASQEHAG